MKFSEVIGQAELKSKLAGSIEEGRVSHAQLFTGRSGYGTLPLALAYAQYLNCTNRRDGDSCGVCPSCVKTSQLAHPDLHFVFPIKTGEKQKLTSDNFLSQWRQTVETTKGYFNEPMWYSAINIDNKQGLIPRHEADEVIRKLSLKSFESDYKIMIIWLPERMNVMAANTLLKILEEPWEKTVFLMVSEAPDKLLPTIISRTQNIVVPRIDSHHIETSLREISDPGKLAAALKTAAGDLIAAKKFINDDDNSTRNFFELFSTLMRLSYNDRHLELFEWSENVASMGREEQKRFLNYCVSMLRESYVLGNGMEELTHIWGQELEFGRKFSPFVNNYNIEALVEEIEQAIFQVSQNGNPRIVFPHLALAVSKLITRK